MRTFGECVGWRPRVFGPGVAPVPTARLADLYDLADGVARVSWPEEAPRLADLRDQGLPRLLLVAPDAEPPVVHDELEDWVRLPADTRDVDARAARLASLFTTAVRRSRHVAGGHRGGIRA